MKVKKSELDILRLPAFRAEMPIRENDVNEIYQAINTLERIFHLCPTPFRRAKVDDLISAKLLNEIYHSVVGLHKVNNISQKWNYYPAKSGDYLTEELFNELVGSINILLLGIEKNSNGNLENYIKLHRLIRELSTDQVNLLETIWEYHLNKSKCIPARLLFNKVEKPGAKEYIEETGGKYLFEATDNGNPCYQITFLGLMATSSYYEVEKILVRYLNYIKIRYIEDPLADQINHKEIESALDLNADESGLLEKVLRLAHFSGSSSGYGEDGYWYTSYPKDVEELRFVEDIQNYIVGHCFKFARLDDYVSENKRYGQYNTNKVSGAALSRDPLGYEIAPAPPPIVQYLLWIKINWKRHWKILLAAIILVLLGIYIGN